MFATWQLVSLSLLYIAVLFAIAFVGDKQRHQFRGKSQPIIYALTLGVYCTSWSFLGTTAQAADNILAHLPIYFGPILLFWFAWPFIQRIIRVSLKLNLTSIADLLAARFGKSQQLAILVTLVAVIGTMPYIALQLKGIVYSFEQLQIEQHFSQWQIGLGVAIVLAGFTIAFGIRTIDVTERHPGVMLAIAFESLVKVIAFVAVALFVLFYLYQSPLDLLQQAESKLHLRSQLYHADFSQLFAMLVIVMAAFLALPRQFHVMVVELKQQKYAKLSRKIFPIYLIIFALLAIPLGLAGKLLLEQTVPSDTYVLFLPWHGGQTWLTLLAFIGAISAASSMVIISAIALSTMLSNEILFPLLFRQLKQNEQFSSFRQQLLSIRKILVCVVIFLGFGVFLLVSPDTLSSLGEIAFGAMAQLSPALVAAFYWRKATLKGVFSGLLLGFAIWLLFSFMPNLGIYQLTIKPSIFTSNTWITIVSLLANIGLMMLVSLLSRQSVQERVQVPLFLEWQTSEPIQEQKLKLINQQELQLLLSRFVGEDKAKQSFQQFYLTMNQSDADLKAYKRALVEHTENTLASVMGASSARLVISSVLEGRDIALDEVAILVEEASTKQQVASQTLLQNAIENASEGISVIDSDLNLVAWNKKYVSLFNYPEELLYVGCPVAKLIRFNAERGLCGAGEVDDQVARRLGHLRRGTSHQSERIQPDGQVIHIQGNPLPGGGFVMLFSDITAYRQAENILKEANLDLESRVAERTQKLEIANRALQQEQQKAKQASRQKSLYLKACSHDLMQPLEAARLFASALKDQNGLNDAQQQLVQNIGDSLKVANDLIASLAEIARIESGNIKTHVQAIALDELFQSLANEFKIIAKQADAELKVVSTRLWVQTDAVLLRRILQNLLANAFRYAAPGKVLLGCRRIDNNLSIQIIDNGPGIAQAQQQRVFEQFTQLENGKQHPSKGLGLGLNISKSFAELLGHELQLKSASGKGCCFSITLPICEAKPLNSPIAHHNQNSLAGIRVLCIDNEPAVLAGMMELLNAWKCQVYGAASVSEAQQVFNEQHGHFDILLVDYQLGDRLNGIELIQTLRQQAEIDLPAILITAALDGDLDQLTAQADIGYMRKMVKPAALRAMINAKLAKRLQSNYLS